MAELVEVITKWNCCDNQTKEPHNWYIFCGSCQQLIGHYLPEPPKPKPPPSYLPSPF